MTNYPAAFTSAADNGAVRCELCPRKCMIFLEQIGFCGARENRGGSLFVRNYGQVSSVALDPIEKKPLHMFMRGSQILSVGGFGCNLRCPYCQNYAISIEYETSIRHGAGDRYMLPEEVAQHAAQAAEIGNIGVAYTYNEPLISYEFVKDCAVAVRNEKLKNVLVTNGFINTEPLLSLLPLIDAMNIDLKAFSEDFYSQIGGKLETVKSTIASAIKHCHVEVTTVVIPGENENDIEALAAWLASLSRDIPLHLSRFFPRYKYVDKAPAEVKHLYRLRDLAKRHLKHVFLGNV